MKKRGAAALLAAICLLAGCAASDPALPAETPTPTETSSPAYQGDSLFAYCTEKQRELLELPHEELPVELIFHHWTETAADYETRDETVIAGVLQALRDVSVESESPIVSTDTRGLTFVTAQGDTYGSKGWMAGAMSFPKMKSFGNWCGGFGRQTQTIRI